MAYTAHDSFSHKHPFQLLQNFVCKYISGDRDLKEPFYPQIDATTPLLTKEIKIALDY